MGIKRLKKVFIISGAENSGKTRFIKEVARRLSEHNFDYESFLDTRLGSILNQALENDINDDIFGRLSNGLGDNIGVISAGDDTNLTKKTLTFLLNFQFDVIICAARTADADIIKSFLETNPIGNELDDKISPYFSITEVKTCEMTKQVDLLQAAGKTATEFTDEILKTIRGFELITN